MIANWRTYRILNVNLGRIYLTHAPDLLTAFAVTRIASEDLLCLGSYVE